MTEKKECWVCKDTEPDWFGYRCEEHDICMGECGRKRSELTEAPWGKKGGFLCKECDEKEKKQLIEDYKPNWKEEEWHNDKIICPYCGSEYCIDDHYSVYEDGNSEDIECPDCDSTFKCSTSVTHYFTATRKEETK